MKITKFWRCPKCGYLTTNEEMQSINFDPECRCYEETGMTWARFIPVIEKENKMKIIEVKDDYIGFDNGSEITFDHNQDCCEHNYADFKQGDY